MCAFIISRQIDVHERLLVVLLQDLQAAGEDPGLLLVAFFKKAASGRQRSEAASAIPVRPFPSLPPFSCLQQSCTLPGSHVMLVTQLLSGNLRRWSLCIGCVPESL